MSLLKGIVYIPRERPADAGTKNVSVAESKHHKKSKSTEKDRKSKSKQHHKHKKSSRNRDETVDSSSEDDYKDFSKFNDEMKSLHNHEIENAIPIEAEYSSSMKDIRDVSESQNDGSSKKQKLSFASLIGSLKSKPTLEKETDAGPEASSKQGYSSASSNDRLNNDKQSHNSDFGSVEGSSIITAASSSSDVSSRRHHSTAEDIGPQKVASTNQSVAELFRAKLKAKNTMIEHKTLTQLIGDDELEAENSLLLSNEASIRNQVINKLRSDANMNLPVNRNVSKAPPVNDKDYAASNAKMNLLLKSEKFGSNDMDENFRDNVLRLGDRYKGTELGSSGAFGNGNLTGADEEEEIDMKLFENKYETEEKVQTKKQILNSLGAGKKRESVGDNQKQNERQREILNRCPHCTAGSSYKSFLTISKGEHTMLRLKTGAKLGFGHCVITPIDHIESFLKCSDEVEIEVARYKSCLRRMFECNGQSVVFLESALQFAQHPHACMDAVPVPLGIAGEARMCFREVLFSLTVPIIFSFTVC
jgi:Protein similar to CwfJ C-terminus 1